SPAHKRGASVSLVPADNQKRSSGCEVDYRTNVPALDQPRQPARGVGAQQPAWAEGQLERSITPEIMSPVRWLKGVIRISVSEIPVCAVEGTTGVHAPANREAAAPGIRRPVGDTMCGTNGELGLQRVVVRTVGVMAVVERGKLRIGHDEILREQSARAESAAVNDLAAWLDSTNICCVQGASHTC